jgi:hypothetical protein
MTSESLIPGMDRRHFKIGKDMAHFTIIGNKWLILLIANLATKMEICNRLIILLITLVCAEELHAQEWEPVREKDGIAVFTRQVENSNYKSFKGEVWLQAEVAEVSDVVEDVKNFELWDESIREIRVLEHFKGKSIRYYVVYNSPWPVTDRDLGIQATISSDPLTGSMVISAVSAPDAVPPDPDMIRIIDYWQKWTITPTGSGLVHLTVEGFADPAGDIPAWLANMAITDTPLNMLRGIREKLQNQKKETK